ncbi:YdcF family protein [Oceanithermus sp.]
MRWALPLALFLLLLAALPQAAPRAAATEPRQALVLGAAQYDGEPSPAFRRRLDAALALWREGRLDRIVVSGGRAQGDRYSEGEAGCRYLERRGVPPEALACETESRSTWDNLRLARPLLEPGPIWIVTDAPHMPRALLLAERLGLDARGWPVEGDFSVEYRLRERALYLLARLGVTHPRP